MEKKTIRALNILAVLLWLGFIFGRSLKPGTESAAESQWVLSLLETLFSRPLSMHAVRKAAHFVEFAVLGFLLGPLFPKKRGGLCAFLLGGAAAVCDESIQRFVPDRYGSGADVLLDCAGVLFGLLLFAGLRALRQRFSPSR